MRHASIIRGKVNIALSRTVFLSRHNAHVDVFFNFGEQQLLFIQPHQTGGVLKPEAWLATDYGDNPGVPLSHLIHCIGDARAVG